MIVEARAAYEAIKGAITVVRGMQNLNTESDVNAAVIEIQERLLEAQERVQQLQEIIREQRSKIIELERFDPELFDLVELVQKGHKYGGRKSYREKATDNWYCPSCFSKRVLSPLQFSSDGTMCYEC